VSIKTSIKNSSAVRKHLAEVLASHVHSLTHNRPMKCLSSLANLVVVAALSLTFTLQCC